MNEKEFYIAVGELLETSQEPGSFPYSYRTRWNNRVPGRGRFANHGLVRCFGPIVHVALNDPKLSGVYPTYELALEAITLVLREASA
jgi:hypothetical protein